MPTLAATSSDGRSLVYSAHASLPRRECCTWSCLDSIRVWRGSGSRESNVRAVGYGLSAVRFSSRSLGQSLWRLACRALNRPGRRTLTLDVDPRTWEVMPERSAKSPTAIANRCDAPIAWTGTGAFRYGTFACQATRR